MCSVINSFYSRLFFLSDLLYVWAASSYFVKSLWSASTTFPQFNHWLLFDRRLIVYILTCQSVSFVPPQLSQVFLSSVGQLLLYAHKHNFERMLDSALVSFRNPRVHGPRDVRGEVWRSRGCLRLRNVHPGDGHVWVPVLRVPERRPDLPQSHQRE